MPYGDVIGGDGGIRTLDRALQPYNGLANRRLQPLGHISGKADMPDAEASRKRQISDQRIPSDLTTQGGGCEFPKLERRRPDRSYLLILICDGRICGADRAMPPSVFFRPAKLAGLKAGARHRRIGFFPA